MKVVKVINGLSLFLGLAKLILAESNNINLTPHDDKKEVISESNLNPQYIPYTSVSLNSPPPSPQYYMQPNQPISSSSGYYVPQNNHDSNNYGPAAVHSSPAVHNEMKDEMAQMKDTVRLLSTIVQQNMQKPVEPIKDSSGYGDQVKVDVYQKQSTQKYPQKATNPPVPVVSLQAKPQPSLIQSLIERKTLDRNALISHASRTFEIIRRGFRTALWTGLVVALVRLAPLLWVGVRLIFNSILPLVGMSLLGQQTENGQANGNAATAPALTQLPIDPQVADLDDSFDHIMGVY